MKVKQVQSIWWNWINSNLIYILQVLCLSSSQAAQSPVSQPEPDKTGTDQKLSETSMSQERLSGLAIMSINHDVGKQISYEDIIDDPESAERDTFNGE